MSEEKKHQCAGGPTLVFACSGAADVGQLSDLAARKMSKDGLGAMFCLVGIGGRVEPIMKKTAAASKILAMDGCSLDCAKKCLEQAGFNRFEHVRITDLGFEKGAAPVNDQSVEVVVTAAAGLLG